MVWVSMNFLNVLHSSGTIPTELVSEESDCSDAPSAGPQALVGHPQLLYVIVSFQQDAFLTVVLFVFQDIAFILGTIWPPCLDNG